MSYIEFDSTRPIDLIPMGRMAIDFNPVIPPFQQTLPLVLQDSAKKSALSAKFQMISSAITSQNSLTMRVSTLLTLQEQRTAKN